MLKPEERDRKIELGELYLKEGNYNEALKFLMDVYLSYSEGENIPSRLLSLYGYAMAVGEKRIDEGIILCIRALKVMPSEPSFYLNLGKIYIKAGKKASAIKVFRRGLIIDRRNREIGHELKRLGIRRRPPIPFLPRRHPLNRFLGLIANRLSEKWSGGGLHPTRSR